MADNINPRPGANNIPATVGNFTGGTLVIDPATGFLTAPEHQAIGKQENGRGMLNAPGYVNGPLSLFTANKKLEFIEFLKEYFPHYSKCAKLCGITRQTFKNHYEIDKKFKLCVDEVIESRIDDVEDVRFRIAHGEKGALDRMAILNAYRRDIYNPSIDLNIKHEMSTDEASKRSQRLGNVVDAQIVDKVKELKRARESNG